jgi:hypothetical protein
MRRGSHSMLSGTEFGAGRPSTCGRPLRIARFIQGTGIVELGAVISPFKTAITRALTST